MDEINERSAMSVIYGLTPIESFDQALAVFDFLSDRPELLTSGQACRGFEQLKLYVYGNE